MADFIKELEAHVRTREIPIIFPESALFQKYIGSNPDARVVEVGPAAHNPYTTKRTKVNVCPNDWEDFTFFANHQWELCGSVAIPSHLGEAEHLPLHDSEFDAYVSSHVLEHCPNPIQCLLEAHRVVRNGGYVFITVPKCDSLESDRGREISDAGQFWTAYCSDLDVESAKRMFPEIAPRGHYWVYSLESFQGLVRMVNGIGGSLNSKPLFEIVESLETDDKVSNGHTLLLRVIK